MDGIDRKIIAELYEKHIEFRRLYDEHMKLHDQLSKFENRKYLSPVETNKEKELKMKKLHGRERLIDIINQHKEPHYQQAANA